MPNARGTHRKECSTLLDGYIRVNATETAGPYRNWGGSCELATFPGRRPEPASADQGQAPAFPPWLYAVPTDEAGPEHGGVVQKTPKSPSSWTRRSRVWPSRQSQRRVAFVTTEAPRVGASRRRFRQKRGAVRHSGVRPGPPRRWGLRASLMAPKRPFFDCSAQPQSIKRAVYRSEFPRVCVGSRNVVFAGISKA